MRLELMIELLKSAKPENGVSAIEISPKFRDSIIKKLEESQLEAQQFIRQYFDAELYRQKLKLIKQYNRHVIIAAIVSVLAGFTVGALL